MGSELILRLSAFLGAFVILAALERLAPRRPRHHVAQRWITNFMFVIIDTLTLRALAIFLPFAAVFAALDAAEQGIGLFNIVQLPAVISYIITILIFDWAIWFQHLISHKVPFLWRIHRVHHADIELDVSSAIRFHPIEIALSMLFKIGLVYVIGPPVWAVILFEVLLNASAMFNHANIKLPLWLDKWLRLVIVTPDMHRVHHSIERAEHDRNYGFALSIWDRAFGTYLENPAKGQMGMKIGLRDTGTAPTRFFWSLAFPFFRK